ncbi:MAG: PEP-CTERM sorting domain-containing protein [Rhodocyclaceae bacterium]|nr:PEP-CTERM sorting domain-containing protein [Rhodocyclaceae bacterium]
MFSNHAHVKQTLRTSLTLAAVLAAVAAPFGSTAQAACLTNNADVVGNPVFGATVGTFVGLGIDPNTTCIENSVWSDPSNFGLGTYVKGADGFGAATNPTILGAYDGSGSAAANANGRDFAWVQDTGAQGTFNGAVGGAPSAGIVWDLGGQANQVAVFVFVDHDPVPGEVLENTAWLSNDPNAADAGWTQAQLVHVYGDGWSADPNIADGFVAVYQLPSAQTFRYVSVTWGGPGAITRDGDNEIDAVGGLTERGTGVIPEPATTALAGLGLAAIGALRRKARKHA